MSGITLPASWKATKPARAWRTSAQTVIVRTKHIGAHVNQLGRPWRFNHTVTEISVNAASSWFEVPNSVQNAMYVGGFPGAGGSAESTNSSGRPTVARVASAALV